jgi:hypothetical protein
LTRNEEARDAKRRRRRGAETIEASFGDAFIDTRLIRPEGAAAPGPCAHVLPLCKATRVGAKGNKGASTRLHQCCAFMQSCEEFGELASLLAAKG